MASILVIDDHPDILTALRRVLEGAGHTVTEAPDGPTALRWFAGQPRDLVVTDIYMPGMDGIELIVRLRETFPQVPVVAMSGGGPLYKGHVLGAASKLGGIRVLAKPFTSDQVLTVVDEALGAS